MGEEGQGEKEHAAKAGKVKLKYLIMKGVKQVDLMDQQCYLETEHAAKAGKGKLKYLIMKTVKQVDLMDQQCYLEIEHAAKAGKGKLSARSWDPQNARQTRTSWIYNPHPTHQLDRMKQMLIQLAIKRLGMEIIIVFYRNTRQENKEYNERHKY